jgi:cell division protein FtsB
MRQRSIHGAEELLERAETAKEKRYIYNGDTRPFPPGYAVSQGRRAGRRKFSTFNIILTLFCAGIAIVLYVNNILTINKLAADVNRLQAKYNAVLNANAALRAEVSRKAAWERISRIATDQLGLVSPKEPPTALEVEGDAVSSPQVGENR